MLRSGFGEAVTDQIGTLENLDKVTALTFATLSPFVGKGQRHDRDCPILSAL